MGYKFNEGLYSSRYTDREVYLIPTDSDVAPLKIDGLAKKLIPLMEEMPSFTVDDLFLFMSKSVPEHSQNRFRSDIEELLKLLLKKNVIYEV